MEISYTKLVAGKKLVNGQKNWQIKDNDLLRLSPCMCLINSCELRLVGSLLRFEGFGSGYLLQFLFLAKN